MPRSGRWTRRDALRASLASGSGALLSSSLIAGPRRAAAQGSSSGTGKAFEFFPEDPRLNQEVLFAIGASGYGAAEFGEISTVIDRIRRRGSSYDAVYDEFGALGQRLSALADGKRARGLGASARRSYLHAAKYLSLPLFFVRGTSRPDREPRDYRLMERAWRGAAELSDPAYERIQIPYGGPGTLPAYFLRPPGPPRRRPTVILNNGNDAQNVDLYAFGGAEAIERGWNALILEGPGQGSMWFLRRIPFRPDWEAVISPIVDYLWTRSDVDRGRISIIGWSQGGELVARAAAFERRLAAAVLDPGVVNVIDEFDSLLGPTGLAKLIREGKRDEANAEWEEVKQEIPPPLLFTIEKTIAPFGGRSFFDTMRYVSEFRITRSLAARIETPTLVTGYEGDDAVGPQAVPMFELLRTEKELVIFRRRYGTQFHDAPMAPQRRNQVLFDWLERTI
jgi:Alpha/beta hydrolase family